MKKKKNLHSLSTNIIHYNLSQIAMEAQKGLFKLAIMLVLIQYVSAQNLPGNERSALINLRSSLGLRGKEWPIKSDPCSSWLGVHCKAGRVIEVTVSGLKRTRVGRLNPQFAVSSLANLTFLVKFNASGFSLPGSIPDWFGQSLVGLHVLDLSSASIVGPIPPSLGNLKKLNALYLAGNSLTGIIPSALGELSGLSILDLSSNLLTGSIPASFSSLVNLTTLDLASNFLTGSIPAGLGALSKLQLLNLSDNSFTSSIPVQLGNLKQLIELNLSKNSLSGPLPLELRGLRSLKVMDTGGNGLEGPLVGNLFSSLSQLQVLVLSGNKLDGGLPRDLWSMPNLRLLDISSNNFTGTLPVLSSKSNADGAVFNLSNNDFYGFLNFSLKSYRSIDFSGNYLQGEVPNDSHGNAILSRNCLGMIVPEQRSYSDCRFFYSQRGLTFEDGVPGSEEANSKEKNHLTFILVGVFGGLGFIVFLVFVLVLLLRFCDNSSASQRVNANAGPVPEGDIPSFPKDPIYLTGLGESYTYEQMLQITNNFSETNLIKHGHSGDLFWALLEGRLPVVIKKVDLSTVKNEPYIMELDFFRKASHIRLVPLLGHCLDHENEKFLVYKYMPNGDLASCLHKATNSADNNLQSLDWITRLKIAIGAAEALSYLHHECNPPFVHRDIQAGSILLDDKFEVRLGSLNEVCVHEGDYHQNFTRFLRKPQTAEQGPSGSSTVTCAHDVYCFGKVLLELVTGKLGISKSDDATTREWLDHTLPYISIYDQEQVTKIIDPSLIIDDDLLEEVWAMAVVAKSCLNPRPSRRPPMRYVLKALERPLEVVRAESSSSARLRTILSRRSWSAAFFGSWRHSSSENAGVMGQGNRESIGSLKQQGRIGSYGSGGNEFSSSHKRLSSEIFPEPVEMQDVERQD